MLKISISEDRNQRRVIVEGKLVAPWTDELKMACKSAGADLDGRKLVIDLKNLITISQHGENLLLELMKGGVQLRGFGVFTKQVLKQIARRIRQEWPGGAQMNCLRTNRTRKDHGNEYATTEDFRRIFTDDMNGLYQLSMLLTGDDKKAQQCFVAGLEDSINSNSVFREWAHTWAKRVVINNAIAAMQPHPDHNRPPLTKTAPNRESTPSIPREEHFEIESVQALESFERFVFVMSVLEGYSDKDCSLLLNCLVPDIREARSRAIQGMAESVRTLSRDAGEEFAGHAHSHRYA